MRLCNAAEESKISCFLLGYNLKKPCTTRALFMPALFKAIWPPLHSFHYNVHYANKAR
jgi:hypothetical protein